MNNKIMKRGSNIGGLVRYLFGKGDSDEHRDQRVIAAAATLGIADGTRLERPGDWPRVLEVARDLDAHRRIAGVAPHDGWVWHCAISLPPGERLDDGQWVEVARTAVRRLGFEADEAAGTAGCRWIAVHHGPSSGGNDHIHIAVNLVREDLRIAVPGRDRMAMSRLCADMERRYGLYVVPGRAGRGMPGYTRAAKERAQRATDRARAQGRPGGRAVPETQTLARKVRAAATLATGEAEFVDALAEAGLLARPRYARGDRTQVIGYSVALPAQASGTDRPIWYGGGKLAADLSLPKLRTRWTTSPATARTTPPDALPAWQHANDVAAGTRAAPNPAGAAGAAGARRHVDAAPSAPPLPPAGGAAGQWWDALDRVEAAARQLQDLPLENTLAWSKTASDTAALLSLLADRIEGELPADLAATAYTLAWSAQTPHRPHPAAHHHDHHHSGARHGGPARELADAARAVRAASRPGGGAEDVAVVVAIAALVLAVLALVALIRAWHDHQQHRRQAAALTEGAGRCEYVARAHVDGVAPPWHRRPHGRLGDAALHRRIDRAAADLARDSALQDRTAELLRQARAGDGPAATRLRERAGALVDAAAAEVELPAARMRLDAARQDQDTARARLAELASLADRGRLALYAHGTTRAQLARAQAAAHAELAAATTAHQYAHAHLADLTRRAAAPYPTRGPSAWREGTATAEHTDLTDRWNHHLAAAITDDVHTAPDRAADLTPEARAAYRAVRHILHASAQHAPTTARARLAELRTEHAARNALPADRADQEQRQRQHTPPQQPTQTTRPDDPHRRPKPPHHGPSRHNGPTR
ncbi:relaxase/mobilization nuclease domain-containing protein [Actinomadura terrae]|uniref:relaxase/mobilization nuclease domain-containing protein n=1 Tax=Actinomadura terrae TaxID=604353 RepID=UPI001FA7B81B|nr:relaxase/mobilization nuclease domain-containing protein [Actinomadura terrae]